MSLATILILGASYIFFVVAATTGGFERTAETIAPIGLACLVLSVLWWVIKKTLSAPKSVYTWARSRKSKLEPETSNNVVWLKAKNSEVA